MEYIIAVDVTINILLTVIRDSMITIIAMIWQTINLEAGESGVSARPCDKGVDKINVAEK